MKNFLLSCVLFVACLAPMAEGAATTPIDYTTGTLYDTILTSLSNDVNTGAIDKSESSLALTVNINTNTATTRSGAALPVPLSFTLTSFDAPDTPIEVKVTDLTITGNSGTLTPADGQRHFKVDTGGNLSLSGLTLKGKSAASTGGVDVEGTASFSGVTFQDNQAATGGAINISSTGTVTLSGTNTFASNKSAGTGGAINVSGGTLTVADNSNLTFTGNTAASHGGAIYSTAPIDLSSATATFGGNSDADANKAGTKINGDPSENGGSGGAICMSGTAATLKLGTKQHTFTKNTAVTSGGAIYTESTLTIEGQNFTGNTVSGITGGGAIYAQNASVEVKAGTFTDNEAKGNSSNGGAIHAGNAEVKITATGGVTFTGDKATQGSGGAIYTTGTVAVAGGAFGDGTNEHKNTALKGGAIFAGTANINGGTFKNNTATGTDATSGGGAVYATTVTLQNNPEFTGNQATGDKSNGGAIYADSNVTISGGTFTSNKASTDTNTGNGGAIYTPLTGNVTSITGGEFSNNTATNGGAIYSGGTGKMSIEGGTFSTNTANTTGTATIANGGAIYSGGSVSITSGDFSNNTASATVANATDANGGAIYATGTITQISGGKFSGNKASVSETATKATANGGAVYSSGTGELKLSGGAFSGNTAANDGGAVYAGGKVTVTNDKGTDFTAQNTATGGNGGAIYSAAGGIETTGTNFTHQRAGLSGGALYSGGNDATVKVNSGTFTDNQTTATTDADNAEVGGGAIYAEGNVIIMNGTFTENKSPTPGNFAGGGAIWAGGTVTVYGGSFASTGTTDANTATGSGGGIYALKGIDITPGSDKTMTFSYQSAGKEGGALYSKGTITAKRTIFKYNKASDTTSGNGGATYSAGESSFENCFFYHNEAGHDGGASVANPLKNAEQCTYYKNAAGSGVGGAVAAKSGTSSLALCVFDENHAGMAGGAIYAGGSGVKLTVETSEFLNNFSSGAPGGGAIATGTMSELTLWRCTFDKNHANGDGSGGAAYIKTAAFKIANCTFYWNDTNKSGGALQLEGGGTDSALVFNTFYKNHANEDGGGISSTANFVIAANIVVDDTAKGKGADIYASSGTMTSRAYNFIRYYGEDGNKTQEWDVGNNHVNITVTDKRNKKEQSNEYTWDTFFERNYPAKNPHGTTTLPPSIGVSSPINAAAVNVNEGDEFKEDYALTTLELKPSELPTSSNPAQAFVPKMTGIEIISSVRNEEIDECGFSRPSKGNNVTWDAGACDTGEGGKGEPDKPGDDGKIYYIEISGLPNTLRTIGQTTSLFAYGYDIHNNLVSRNVSVTWNSSNTSVAKFVGDNSSGNIVIVGAGKTIISATTTSGGLTDSTELTVDEDSAYSMQSTNFYPSKEVMGKLGIYLEELAPHGASLAFADVSPASVTSSAFQSAFKGLWNVAPSQVTTLTNASEVNFYSRPAKTDALKPGVNVAITGRAQGDVLPMEYTWTYSYDDLSKLLDRNVTTPPSAAELAKFMRIDFETFSGATVPVVGSAANAKAGAALSTAQVGVSAVDAVTTEALSIKESSNGITLHLTAYLANVQDTNASGSKLVQRLLVVPDGVADNAISGTMWMNKKANSSSDNGNNNKDNSDNGNGGNGNGSGGGGGGCDTAGLGLGLAILFLTLPLQMRKRRR